VARQWLMRGDGERLSDAALIQEIRSGNSDAYAVLWRRHAAAGLAVARRFRLDADDLLSESFARILRTIQRGAGPEESFRPYLATTIRNLASEWAREARNATPTDDLDAVADPASEEDAAVAAVEQGLAVSAFRNLPRRWQEALWYSEVEKLGPTQMAPLLGMKANAVAALTFRAREGLRQEWIKAHLLQVDDPDCRATIDSLAAYARGTLGRRERDRVEQHLRGCARCPVVADEARRIGSSLLFGLLLAVAGVGGTAGFLRWTDDGGHAGLEAGASAAVAGGAHRLATVGALATSVVVAALAGPAIMNIVASSPPQTVVTSEGDAAGAESETAPSRAGTDDDAAAMPKDAAPKDATAAPGWPVPSDEDPAQAVAPESPPATPVVEPAPPAVAPPVAPPEPAPVAPPLATATVQLDASGVHVRAAVDVLGVRADVSATTGSVRDSLLSVTAGLGLTAR
jgi:RNA polymerase sigma factor (sigma-70 family)